MADISPASNHDELMDAVRELLRQSEEPLTIPKLRERLLVRFRAIRVEELTDLLERQVAAQVLVVCPKYRSSQNRYWDRPLREHAKVVLRETLAEGPISWADLRKKFPKYLRHLAESALNEELAKGAIHRHPPASPRMGPRYALQPADVRSYARKELRDVLARLQECGFARETARETLMQLLQEDEWADQLAGERVGVLT